MDAKPSTTRDFKPAADRRAAERERLIAQLADEDRLRVEEFRNSHAADVSAWRQLQAGLRPFEIREERERLVREHPQPALRPDGHRSRQRSAGDIERQAAKAVDFRNCEEISRMTAERDAAIDGFLHERGLSYDQFKGEREQLAREQIAARENNDITREI